MTPDLPPVEHDLVQWAEERCEVSRVEVLQLGLPGGTEGVSSVRPVSGDPCHRRPSLRVEVKWSSGERRVMTAFPVLEMWVKVPVTLSAVEPGDLIASVQMEERSLWTLGGRPGAAGWEAIRALAAGSVITDRVAHPRPDARAGEEVTLVVVEGQVRLSAPGVLMGDGAIGATVDVLNEVTKRRQTGVLVARDRVELL